MKIVPSPIESLRRPRLLVTAAQAGARDYDRRRTLPRIFGERETPPPSQAVERLLPIEAAFDRDRREGGTTYSVVRHVECLIALLAEARLARA